MLIRRFSNRPTTGCISIAADTETDAVRVCELVLVGALHGYARPFVGNRMAARAAAKSTVFFRPALARLILRCNKLFNDRAGEALEAPTQRRFHRHRGLPPTMVSDEIAVPRSCNSV